jgi:hypothetical protein
MSSRLIIENSFPGEKGSFGKGCVGVNLHRCLRDSNLSGIANFLSAA